MHITSLQTITHHSRSNYFGPVKVSKTTPNNQVILQDRQRCSKPTKNFPGHFVLIPPIQSHQRHHPSLETHPGPFKSSKSFVDRLSPLQDHQLCSRSTQTYPDYLCLPQLLQTIATIPHYSRITLEQSKPPRLLQMTKTYSKNNSIVPGPPRHLLATSFSSQPLQTIIVITQTHHGPLKASQSLPDQLALLQDHQLCSRYTQTNPGYTHAYRSLSRLSLPSPITPELPWTSPSLPDHCRKPGLTPGPPALFQTNHDLP